MNVGLPPGLRQGQELVAHVEKSHAGGAARSGKPKTCR